MSLLLALVLSQTVIVQPARTPAGVTKFDVNCVSGCSGSAGGGGQASIAIDGGTYLNQPLPAGSATIGAVNVNGTVPISAASLPTHGVQVYASSDNLGTTWKPLQYDDSASDGIATQTDGLLDTDAHLRGFNGATFDRIRSGGTNADGVATTAVGAVSTQGFLLGWNGTTWDRIVAEGSDVDAEPTLTKGLLGVESYNMLFNGTTWDRQRGDTTSGAWVNVKNASIAVTGTFWQSTQPVSLASLPALTAGSAVVGKVGIDQTTPGTTNGVQMVTATGAGNPCRNPHATLQSVFGSTSGTASVQLVALSGSTKIFVCSMIIVGTSGTTPTFALRYGTGTACATGTVTIIGAFTTTANTVFNFSTPFAVTPAGQALCYIQTGTTPISTYAITYVQL